MLALLGGGQSFVWSFQGPLRTMALNPYCESPPQINTCYSLFHDIVDLVNYDYIFSSVPKEMFIVLWNSI